MEQKRSRFFSVMVVGDDPAAITKKYDLNLKVEPYIKYRYLDAGKYKSTSIKALEKILSEADKITLPTTTREALKIASQSLKSCVISIITDNSQMGYSMMQKEMPFLRKILMENGRPVD